MTDTDKEQQEQNCREWMKTHWLDTVMILLLFSLLIFLIWQCNWLLESENRHVIRRLAFISSAVGVIYGLTLLIRRYCLEGVLVIFASLITALVTCLWELLIGPGEQAGLTIRTLVLIYAALGAFYGLSLGAKRLKATEKQIKITGEQIKITGEQIKITREQLKVNEAGLFNDRLGRVVEALASEKLYIREVGLILLADLYRDDGGKHQHKILNLLDQFIQNRAGIYDPDEETKAKSKDKETQDERTDIETAIKILGGLVSKDRGEASRHCEKLKQREFEKWFEELERYKERRPHKELKPSFEQQRYEALRYLIESNWLGELKLQKLDFYSLRLQKVNLQGADLRDTNLTDADLTDANLQGTELIDTIFQNAILKNAKLQKASLENANLKEANFERAEFEKTDLTKANLENAENLTPTQLLEAIYNKNKPYPILPAGLKIPKENAYKWEKDEKGRERRRFVSGKREWIDPEFWVFTGLSFVE